MQQEREDMRIVKTKRALCDALGQLMQRKPFSKITVSEICSQALVSRAAFYAHYEDKHALFNDVLRAKQADIIAEARASTPEAGLRRMLEAIRDDGMFYRLLVTDNLDWRLVELLGAALEEMLANAQQDFTAVQESAADSGASLAGASVPNDMRLRYCAGGLTAIVARWVRDDYAYDVEELVRAQMALLVENSL